MCKASTIRVAPSAMETRGGGKRVGEINKAEKQMSIDHAAYRRLRKEGIKPRSTEGVAKLERHATTKFEIESGNLIEGKAKYVESRVNEGMAISKEKGYVS